MPADLNLLRWVAIVGPPAFLGVLELVQRLLFPDLFDNWTGYLILGGVVLVTTVIFAEVIFTIIGRVQAQLAMQNRALAVAEERERIAHEMHDSLAQVLGYANAKAQAAQVLLDAGQTERAAEQVAQLAEAARDAYADVREGILGLRTSLGPDRDFLATLRAYLEQWQRQSGVAVELELSPVDGFTTRLPPFAEVQLIRIIQEALTNVRKHAAATQALIRMEATGGELRVEIADYGTGFDPTSLGRTAFPRFGLATMRERAEAVGGAFAVESVPGEGTTVTVSIPREAPALAMEGGRHARADRG